MEMNLVEAGFVCQVVFSNGKFLSVSVRDARSGQLVYHGDSMTSFCSFIRSYVQRVNDVALAQRKSIDNG